MLLSSQSIPSGSPVSSVDFNSLISNSYSTYKIIFDSAECLSSSVTSYLMIQVSDDGGSTYQTASYINFLGGILTTGIACGFLYDSSGTNLFVSSGNIDILNLTSGLPFISAVGLSTFFDATALFAGGQSHHGVYNGTPLVVDSLRVVSSDGNPISGNFYLYGY